MKGVKSVFKLAFKSIANRKFSAILTVLAISLSLSLFLGVQKIKRGAEASFEQTISGVDLIVGARSGDVNLILYSVFHIGNPTANITWKTYQDIASTRGIAWTIPLALGDSHRGFRVVGTDHSFFEHFQFGDHQDLKFSDGAAFEDLFDVVIGADVARELGYELGDEIILAHGIGAVSFSKHDNLPFKVKGVLAPTGTPVDRTLMTSLEAIEAIHIGWESGAPSPITRITTADKVRALNLKPTQLTAFYVGVTSKSSLLRFQRAIGTYREEPLTAVIPGVALREMWRVVGVAEKTLSGVSVFVVFVGLLTILISILTSLNERRREMAVVRAIGARPWQIFALLVLEAAILALAGGVLSIALLYGGLTVGGPVIERMMGARLIGVRPEMLDLLAILSTVAAASFMAMIPAWRAYRNSLADGLALRV